MFFDHLVPISERHSSPKVRGTNKKKPRVARTLPAGINNAKAAVAKAWKGVVGGDGAHPCAAIREQNAIIELIFGPRIVYAEV